MTNGSDENATNPSLLRRLRDNGDRQAWSLFVDSYGPLLFSYCRRRGLQISDASDVTQEVFAIVAKAITTFEYERERGRFRDWLGTITHRELLRFWRKTERQTRDRSVDGQTSVETAEDRTGWDSHFHSELLQVALARVEGFFTKETWNIFDRVWLQNEDSKQVAQSLNIQVGSVYVAKSRVLDRLRAEVIMLCEDWPTLENVRE